MAAQGATQWRADHRGPSVHASSRRPAQEANRPATRVEEQATRNIALVTIPGTGTRFFDELLSRHYPKTPLEYPGLTTLHVNEDLLERLREVKPFLVTTWRPYENIKRADHPLPELWEAWKRLVVSFAPEVVTIEPKYLGISREQLLGRLGEKLGVTLETDWTPVR